MLRDDFGEFAELVDAVVERVVERADVDFECVAGFHHDDRDAVVVMALVEPALERLRRHGGRAAQFRLDQRHAHRDDFLLDANQHAAVRLFGRHAFLPLQVGQAGVAAHPGEVLVDLRARAGDEHVDALRRQQDRALQAQLVALRLVLRAQFFEVVEGDELVGGDIDVHDRECGRT